MSAGPKPRILVLTVGGTLGMVPGPDGALRPAKSGAELLQAVPLVRSIADFELLEIANLDSTDVGPPQWGLIAKAIEMNYRRFDGFIATHGTDSMAFSTGATSLALGSGLAKPVTFVGSQLQIGTLGSDAAPNLENAFKATVDAIEQRIAEVMLVFGPRILRGSRCVKVSPTAFDGFRSPMFPDLGAITTNGVTFRDNVRRATGREPRELVVAPTFDSRVLSINLMPHQDPRPVQLLLQSSEYECKALLLRAFGPGNVPETFLPAITTARDLDIPVVLTTTFVGGRAAPANYEAGARAVALGAISAEDLTDEMAFLKLAWLIGQGRTPDQVRHELTMDFVGETTERTIDLRADIARITRTDEALDQGPSLNL